MTTVRFLLSMLINVTKNTEASLGIIDIAPATLQVTHRSPCFNENGKIVTIISISWCNSYHVNTHKTESVRLLNSMSWNFICFVYFFLHIKTNIFPNIAFTPMTHIMATRALSANSLTQVRYGDFLPEALHLASGGLQPSRNLILAYQKF